MRSFAGAILLSALCWLCGMGCGEAPSPAAGAKVVESPLVIVTTAGFQDVVETLAGQAVRVQNVVPPEKFSPDWRPRKEAAKLLQQASLVLLNGADWEPWTERVALAPSRTVDTTAGISSRLIRIPDAVTHRHGPEGSHSHAGTVWSTWLSPSLLNEQIGEIERRLIRMRPEGKADVVRESGRMRVVLQKSSELCQQIQAGVTAEKPVVLADSSCWLYLLRDAGLEGPYLHWSPTGALPDRALEELETAAEKLPAGKVRLLLLHRQFSEAVTVKAEQLGFRVVLLDDCLRPDATARLVDRVAGNVQRLHDAFFIVKP